ncbi:MAG: 50S ribosomal protein L25 [Candidatus Nealsonbacteria bacterium CG_4_8_14_3_um_filter_37_36]|uniref:Large ribosomal subunit protein bL25 n=2 Tax=Candidatus Nealsoniibacteriota TaxID=1817911 RepID=A0A2H9N350_9BACT|nr:MAG: 50S ribosomal protein L25 [Candidatus Nealsonbacteria bacterium CG_4_8_14_3_um_filter_37_36]PJA83538.1 MAG: 50S ribosomal protein L25 [Candidatus Nealsonbacteria bacterium CG_4_9_14_3_um_filter_37_29]
MLSLSAKIRKDLGKKVKNLRQKGILPGVLYGPTRQKGGYPKKAQPLELNEKQFEKVYKEAGESSLISLEVEGKRFPVLIHEIQLAPLTGKPIHVDFYQPALEEEVTVEVPLVFEGTSPAVKDLGGTLVKNISELKIKAKPQNLPHEIKVNIESLKTFEDNIKISNLKVPEGVRILKGPEEFVASVSPPEKVEEELVKPIEEKVEEVEKVEEKKKEEVEEKK